MTKKVLNLLGAPTLALVLIVAVSLLAVAGAVIPQDGAFNPDKFSGWKTRHPMATPVIEILGFFGIFHSGIFLAVIVLIGVNTLACTVSRVLKDGGLSGLTGPGSMKKKGFVVLHLGLIGVLVGGFVTAGYSMRGYVILTEGQTFIETHNRYLQLIEGHFRREEHREFMFTLDKIEKRFEGGRYLVDLTADVGVFEEGDREPTRGPIRVNHPFVWRDYWFTIDRAGYSPGITVVDRKTGRVLLDAFIALKSVATENGDEHRDFATVPGSGEKLTFTLFPSHKKTGQTVTKTGDNIENPVLKIEWENPKGGAGTAVHLPVGETAEIAGLAIRFKDLRQWLSFMIVHDPGYALVWPSLWLGLAGFVLRYLPDFAKWFGKENTTDREHS